MQENVQDGEPGPVPLLEVDQPHAEGPAQELEIRVVENIAAIDLRLAGAPDFPVGKKDLVLIHGNELKVARAARKSIRKEVQNEESKANYHQSRKDLAIAVAQINKKRLKLAARHVRAKEDEHRQAQANAKGEEDSEEDDLGPTPARSSPVPEDEVVDLTADEAED